MSDLFKLPGVLNPRSSVWATKCIGCGVTVRLGRGSEAAMRRLLALTLNCDACRDVAPERYSKAK